MTLALLALGAGVVAGYARGGGLARLATVRPRRNRLLVTAVGLHALGVLGGWVWEPLLPVLVGLSWVLFAFYAWVNRTIHGAALIAIGLAANAMVMLVNGAMPVSERAAGRAGADLTAVMSTGDHEPITPETRLPWLGEVVPVAFPPRPEVVSPGDVAIAAGIAVLIGMGLTGRREPVPASHAAEQLRPEDVDDLDASGDLVEARRGGRATMSAEAEPRRSAVM